MPKSHLSNASPEISKPETVASSATNVIRESASESHKGLFRCLDPSQAQWTRKEEYARRASSDATGAFSNVSKTLPASSIPRYSHDAPKRVSFWCPSPNCESQESLLTHGTTQCTAISAILPNSISAGGIIYNKLVTRVSSSTLLNACSGDSSTSNNRRGMNSANSGSSVYFTPPGSLLMSRVPEEFEVQGNTKSSKLIKSSFFRNVHPKLMQVKEILDKKYFPLEKLCSQEKCSLSRNSQGVQAKIRKPCKPCSEQKQGRDSKNSEGKGSSKKGKDDKSCSCTRCRKYLEGQITTWERSDKSTHKENCVCCQCKTKVRSKVCTCTKCRKKQSKPVPEEDVKKAACDACCEVSPKELTPLEDTIAQCEKCCANESESLEKESKKNVNGVCCQCDITKIETIQSKIPTEALCTCTKLMTDEQSTNKPEETTNAKLACDMCCGVTPEELISLTEAIADCPKSDTNESEDKPIAAVTEQPDELNCICCQCGKMNESQTNNIKKEICTCRKCITETPEVPKVSEEAKIACDKCCGVSPTDIVPANDALTECTKCCANVETETDQESEDNTLKPTCTCGQCPLDGNPEDTKVNLVKLTCEVSCGVSASDLPPQKDVTVQFTCCVNRPDGIPSSQSQTNDIAKLDGTNDKLVETCNVCCGVSPMNIPPPKDAIVQQNICCVNVCCGPSPTNIPLPFPPPPPKAANTQSEICCVNVCCGPSYTNIPVANDAMIQCESCCANEPESILANKPDDILTNKPEGVPANKPEGILTNKPESIPANKPESILTNKPEGILANKPEGILANKPEGILTNKLEIKLPEPSSGSMKESIDIHTNKLEIKLPEPSPGPMKHSIDKRVSLHMFQEEILPDGETITSIIPPEKLFEITSSVPNPEDLSEVQAELLLDTCATCCLAIPDNATVIPIVGSTHQEKEPLKELPKPDKDPLNLLLDQCDSCCDVPPKNKSKTGRNSTSECHHHLEAIIEECLTCCDGKSPSQKSVLIQRDSKTVKFSTKSGPDTGIQSSNDETLKACDVCCGASHDEVGTNEVIVQCEICCDSESDVTKPSGAVGKSPGPIDHGTKPTGSDKDNRTRGDEPDTGKDSGGPKPGTDDDSKKPGKGATAITKSDDGQRKLDSDGKPAPSDGSPTKTGSPSTTASVKDTGDGKSVPASASGATKQPDGDKTDGGKDDKPSTKPASTESKPSAKPSPETSTQPGDGGKSGGAGGGGVQDSPKDGGPSTGPTTGTEGKEGPGDGKTATKPAADTGKQPDGDKGGAGSDKAKDAGIDSSAKPATDAAKQPAEDKRGGKADDGGPAGKDGGAGGTGEKDDVGAGGKDAGKGGKDDGKGGKDDGGAGGIGGKDDGGAGGKRGKDDGGAGGKGGKDDGGPVGIGSKDDDGAGGKGGKDDGGAGGKGGKDDGGAGGKGGEDDGGPVGIGSKDDGGAGGKGGKDDGGAGGKGGKDDGGAGGKRGKDDGGAGGKRGKDDGGAGGKGGKNDGAKSGAPDTGKKPAGDGSKRPAAAKARDDDDDDDDGDGSGGRGAGGKGKPSGGSKRSPGKGQPSNEGDDSGAGGKGSARTDGRGGKRPRDGGKQGGDEADTSRPGTSGRSRKPADGGGGAGKKTAKDDDSSRTSDGSDGSGESRSSTLTSVSDALKSPYARKALKSLLLFLLGMKFCNEAWYMMIPFGGYYLRDTCPCPCP